LDLATRGMGKMRAGDKVDHNSPFLNLLACIPKSQGFTEFPAIPFQALYAPKPWCAKYICAGSITWSR
jgi:hypothetical protein